MTFYLFRRNSTKIEEFNQMSLYIQCINTLLWSYHEIMRFSFMKHKYLDNIKI